jgi:hypothetical protein
MKLGKSHIKLKIFATPISILTRKFQTLTTVGLNLPEAHLKDKTTASVST